MASLGTFPFGQPVQKVIRAGHAPESVLVPGVYASAVHARIHWFLSHEDRRQRRLADFLEGDSRYGDVHRAQLENREMQVLPFGPPAADCPDGPFVSILAPDAS